MHTSKPLHLSLSQPAVPTLDEAVSLVGTWTDLTPARRRDLVTALNTLRSLVGGAAPGRLPLDPRRCLALLHAASPVALGISPASLHNRQAGLRAVLRRLGLLAPAHRREAMSTPAWVALLARLPARFHPHRLRAFMAWCDGQGIAPGDVSSGTLAQYLACRERAHGGPNLRNDAREVARQWNKMRSTVPGWPDNALALAPIERPAAPAFETYSLVLQQEVAAFAAWAGTNPDALLDADDEDNRPGLAAVTVEGHVGVLRILLWGAAEQGYAPASLRDLLIPQLARDALAWHLARLGKPDPARPTRKLPTATIGNYASILRLLLRFFRVEGPDAKAIHGLVRKATPPRQKEVTPKVAAMLEATDDPATQRRLVRLPVTLMAMARRQLDGDLAAPGTGVAPNPRLAAQFAALGAAAQILLNQTLRISDVVGLRIGEHWRWVPPARGRGQPRLHIQVDSQKTGIRVEHIFEGKAAQLLRDYEETFRPLGPHPDTPWVFPARDRADRPRTAHHFSEAIARRTVHHVGARMTAHHFRARAAETILQHDHTALEDVRLLLGHSSYSTAARHYRRRDRLGAARRLSAILDDTAKALPVPPAPPVGGRRRRPLP